MELSQETLRGLAALAALTGCERSEVIAQLVRERLEELRRAATSAGDAPSLQPRWERDSLYLEAREWNAARMEAELSARLAVLRPGGGEAWLLAQSIVRNAEQGHLAFEVERRANPESARALSELRTILEALHSADPEPGGATPPELAKLGATGGDVP